MSNLTNDEFIELSKKFLQYSFKDINDYDELTILEKVFCSRDQFNKLKKYIKEKEN